jgi:hypothetical protein
MDMLQVNLAGDYLHNFFFCHIFSQPIKSDSSKQNTCLKEGHRLDDEADLNKAVIK